MFEWNLKKSVHQHLNQSDFISTQSSELAIFLDHVWTIFF